MKQENDQFYNDFLRKAL